MSCLNNKNVYVSKTYLHVFLHRNLCTPKRLYTWNTHHTEKIKKTKKMNMNSVCVTYFTFIPPIVTKNDILSVTVYPNNVTVRKM